MLKILYAGCHGLSPVISAQSTIDICVAAGNHEKINKPPLLDSKVLQRFFCLKCAWCLVAYGYVQVFGSVLEGFCCAEIRLIHGTLCVGPRVCDNWRKGTKRASM